MTVVRSAMLMTCVRPRAGFDLDPELEFEAKDDGVLLVSCRALGLDQAAFELEGQKEANGDLNLVIHDDACEIEIEMTIPDTDYSQIW